ncbi:MAG: aromatic ring-hydroxylating dioxygenase subunit alpha [Anaerolineae bacterium]|nr:aromatic ring-hydroxylating dioxygenase subunit alpha [Anaerolineae bacterium]
MIPNQWYVVLDSTEVKGRPIGVTRLGERLVFWRDSAGKVHCARDKCAHRGAALSKGKVLGDHIQCPFHGFEYAPDGRAVVLPALGRNTPAPERFHLATYPTYEAHGFIWIWWGEKPPADLKPPRFFDDLDDSFTYGQVRDPWNAHYSRVIENQLDPIHLPFVHHNTIGRGGRTIVDGPVIRWVDEDMFRVYVSSRVDDGIPPRRPEEVEIRDGQVYLEFIFPNLWQNHISEDVRVVAAFVPVDEEHTILYLRFYQRFIRIPVLRDLVNWLAMPFNRLVAHQDRRVVETQVPKPSALQMGEQLVQGDRPVVEYRRRRHELLQQGGLR